MTWKLGETNGIIDTFTFECDSCDQKTSFSGDSYVACWPLAQYAGWTTHKRTGSPWTHHCPKCRQDAEQAHEDYLKREQERERIRDWNSR